MNKKIWISSVWESEIFVTGSRLWTAHHHPPPDRCSRYQLSNSFTFCSKKTKHKNSIPLTTHPPPDCCSRYQLSNSFTFCSKNNTSLPPPPPPSIPPSPPPASSARLLFYPIIFHTVSQNNTSLSTLTPLIPTRLLTAVLDFSYQTHSHCVAKQHLAEHPHRLLCKLIHIM